MAIIHSHIFDNASGSVGNVTICRYKGKNIAKGKIYFKSKKQSTAQVIQQIRFKVLSEQAYHFHAAIRAGSPHQSWSTSRVQFIGMNQNAVEIDKETLNITFHPEQLTFTTGNLTPPAVNVLIQVNERIIHAEWLRQPLSPIAKDEDNLFLVIYDIQKQDSLAYPLGKRGLPGTKEFPLHEDFTPANCIAYVFALSPVNTRASVSKYTNIILE
ncbi:hypothetical protein DWW18_00130 [Butyricimonas virosa]|uniref:Uncharacterized protein n=1 Tax=Butyricimonas virosa TaxID=544645 RepID=A0A412X6L9_9BACT|nr:hypothetical protein [Butyricimonas virosa]RGV36647.1 hypothetical protein DWW18_00130 [Butyricimonas virosa]